MYVTPKSITTNHKLEMKMASGSPRDRNQNYYSMYDEGCYCLLQQLKRVP